MKKVFFAGLCGALLIGSAHQADADFREDIRNGLIVTAVVAGTVALVWSVAGLCEVSSYFEAQSKLSTAKSRHPETFELLERIDLMTFDCNDVAQELLLQHGTAEYTYLEAISALDRVVPIFREASRAFRNTTNGLGVPKYRMLKDRAHKQFELVEALIKNANEVAVIIRNTPQFAWEDAEIERKAKEARQHQLDLINANQPKNQVQVKQVQ